tara:strand:- start:3201 stop:3596 length:396 start_codon:yes stop_codon:yes gene_type:complete
MPFQPSQNGIVQGHFWVEDEEGNVIFDPDFFEHAHIKRVNKLTDEKIYKHASKDLARTVIMEWVMKFMLDIKKQFKDEVHMVVKHNKPQWNCCAPNVALYKLGGGKGKVCYGSMGWKTKKGKDYYEFEVCE